jgi:PhnB protein
MPVQPIPQGYHTVTPYIVAGDANALIEFTKRAFGAEEVHVMRMPDGRVMHGDVMIGNSHVMIGQAGGENKPFPAMLYLYVPDVDATFKQATAAGGTSIHEPATQFYGDRHGAVTDAEGNQWWIATHVEDVPEDELQRRGQAAMAQRAAAT